jgi:hypothetical protein
VPVFGVSWRASSQARYRGKPGVACSGSTATMAPVAVLLHQPGGQLRHAQARQHGGRARLRVAHRHAGDARVLRPARLAPVREQPGMGEPSARP